MQNFGFALDQPASVRVDKCDSYRFELTKSTWNTLLCEVGNFSGICQSDFPQPRRGTKDGSAATSQRTVRSSAVKQSRRVILFVAGDRGGSQRNQAQIPRELKAIQEGIDASKHRELFEVVTPILAASRQTLVEAYRRNPTILHLAGHGDDRSLSLICDQGIVVTETQLLASELEAILGGFPTRVRLCVLNTCSSAEIAQQLVAKGVVEAAIGWTAKVPDATAIAFSRAFYGCITDGLSLSNAMTLASQSCGADPHPSFYVGATITDVVFV
jgi:hypothetical protein